MSRQRWQGCLFISLILGAAAPLWAQPAGEDETDPSKVHFARGVEAFSAGDYETALAEFIESNELKPNWKLKYNIGICYKLTNRYARALKELRAYLEEGKDQVPEERKEEVERIVEELADKVGKVVLCCDTGTVDVALDDLEKTVVAQGEEIILDPGIHKIIVTKEGCKSFTTEVSVVPGKTEEVKVKLDPVEGEKMPAPGGDEVVQGDGGDAHASPGTIKGATKKDGGRKKAFAWLGAGFGIGVVLLAGIAVTGALVLVKKGEMQDAVDGCPVTLTRQSCERAYELQDEGNRLKLATNILIAGAAAAATIGLVGFLIAGRPWKKNEKRAKVSLSASLFPDAGVGVKIDF